jgi:lysozyme
VNKGPGAVGAALRRPAILVSLAAVALSLVAAVSVDTRGAQAAGPYLNGIDVSRWQGKPSWPDVKQAGVRFVIAKASEGRDWRDPEYARNRTALRNVGIPFTAYHFARPDGTAGDAVAEADNFVAAARLDGRNLIPVLDLEDHGSLGRRALVRWTKAWLARVDARLGVKAMIYTSPSFWVERMGNTRWFADNGYRLWIAHWRVDSPRVPASNWGGRGWTLWQHSDCGSVSGIKGCVDLDRYAGDRLAPLKIRNNR